ncbi:hypothetical protein AMATHDRAFT_153877 [Amanita thiersii Skay4041]|uniref:DUF4604 domain-containing protein n=1 Tax=Amanita thiersii Skay4041 TaxID=703135 RepID=A0A2A9NBS4_9AGAR|nr:hypothetical protein AMATHDRAFT_153877 [Amanita thiersii Skay4041]
MPPKELTKHQLSARLSYNQHVPAFLRRMQNQISGRHEDSDEENEMIGDPELEDFDQGSGRPPIPRRPPIPERPVEDPGSADEDNDDEKPQVVVLKQGKHLSEFEAENERRKAKGLPLLPNPALSKEEKEEKGAKPSEGPTEPKNAKSSKNPALSFSTSKSGFKSTTKRKAVGQPSDDESSKKGNAASAGPKKVKDSAEKNKKPSATTKKQKKNKTLLSFGDDA